MRRLSFFIFHFSFFILLGGTAHAGLIDSLNLAPLVPVVLDALMTVATGIYEFFVGNGTGIIYMLVWGWLGFWMGMYLVKMYFPKNWLKFFGFSDGGEMWEDKTPGGMTIAQNLLKPAVRAIIAATILLQVRPIFVTDWLVDPFLRFGALYTDGITATINADAPDIEIKCPPDVVAHGWISEDSCNFLIRPVSDLSRANNTVIKRGFEYLLTFDFMNIITGIVLISTFVSSNFLMALLVIQGIFGLGMALALYPFKVLMWVAKKSDKWFDVLPVFVGIIDALKKLVISMIACAFILCINIAVAGALFDFDNVSGFGGHSMVWLSGILTLYLIYRIFSITRGQLQKYAPGMDDLHKSVTGDAKSTWKNVTGWGKNISKVFKK